MSALVPRRARLCACVLFTSLLVLTVAAQAVAGTYQVHACDASNVNRTWAPYGDTGLVAADASCLADPARGMKVRNSLRAAGQVPVLAPYGRDRRPPGGVAGGHRVHRACTQTRRRMTRRAAPASTAGAQASV